MDGTATYPVRGARSCGGAWRRALLALALTPFAAAAQFDSEAWLAQYADDTEVERLKAAYAKCAEAATTPAENIVLPIEQYPDGRIKSQLTAARAQFFLDTGFVWGADIVVEQYDEKGAVTGSLKADNCLVDRKRVTGWVAGNATARMGDVTITGRGIFFAFKREFVKITEDAAIEVKSVHVDFGRLL